MTCLAWVAYGVISASPPSRTPNPSVVGDVVSVVYALRCRRWSSIAVKTFHMQAFYDVSLPSDALRLLSVALVSHAVISVMLVLSNAPRNTGVVLAL